MKIKDYIPQGFRVLIEGAKSFGARLKLENVMSRSGIFRST